MFSIRETSMAINPTDLIIYEKTVMGCLFGSGSPSVSIPKLLSLYRSGLIDLDGMITRTYPLSEINQGYQDMRDGKNVRGVIIYN